MKALIGFLVFLVLPAVFLAAIWIASKKGGRDNPINMGSISELWASAKSGNVKSIGIIVFVLTMIVFITVIRIYFWR